MTITALALPTSQSMLSRGPFTLVKQPTSVTATITGATEGNSVAFFTRGMQPVGGAYVDSAGEAHIYDLDDGGYFATEIGTGNAWSITISGTTVTVVRLSTVGTLILAYSA